jgi:hypothetical protein
VDVSLHDDAAAGVPKREAGGVVALGGAVDEEPASLRAPGVGGQALGLLEGGVLADVDALDPGWDVAVEGLPPEGLDRRRVGAESALVPRDVEASRPALSVGEDRVEVRGLVLVGTGGPLPGVSRADRLRSVRGHRQ